jgi:hypothetical protein
MDGFGGYGQDQFAKHYPLGSPLSRGGSINPTGGRFGTPALVYGSGRPAQGDNNGYMDIPNPVARIIIRLEFYIGAWAPSGQNYNTLFAFYDLNGNRVGTIEFDEGYLQFRYVNPNSGQQTVECAQTSGATLNPNSWNYIDIDITAGSSSNGTMTLYANGTQVATASNITTSNDAVIAAVGGFCSSAQVILDHFCLYDPTSGPYTGILPPTRVLTGSVSGNGRVNAWTPNGQSTNHACVATTEPSDSQYVSDANAGDIDDYALAFAPADVALSAVLAVQVTAVARTDDTQSHTVEIGVGNGTTESFGAARSVPQSYEPLVQAFETNPLTSAAWAIGDLTTLQAAVKLVS